MRGATYTSTLEGKTMDQHINDELERAVWAVENQRLEPLASFIRGLPGVKEASGRYLDGHVPRHRIAAYLGIDEEDVPQHPDQWMVDFKLTRNKKGWETLAVLAWVFNDRRVLKEVSVRLYPFAACACHNDSLEGLCFIIEGIGDPAPVLTGVEEVLAPLLATPED
jgi:hypothetical protein